MSTFRKDIDETKYMCFWTKNDELLEKVKNSIKTQKYVKAKIKSYNGKINTDFHNNKIAKEGSQFICLSVILIDFFF